MVLHEVARSDAEFRVIQMVHVDTWHDSGRTRNFTSVFERKEDACGIHKNARVLQQREVGKGNPSCRDEALKLGGGWRPSNFAISSRRSRREAG
jgi:hypothetical protein